MQNSINKGAKKFAVVDAAELKKLQGDFLDSPAFVKTQKLDREIKDILMRENLEEEDKLRLYSETLNRFLQFYKQVEEAPPPPPPPMVTTEEKMEEVEEEEESFDPLKKLKTFKQRQQADSILKLLQKYPNRLDWDEEMGAVFIKGYHYPQTDLSEILNYITKKKTPAGEVPKAAGTFVEELGKMREACPEWIQNRALQEIFTRSQEGGGDKKKKTVIKKWMRFYS